MTGQQAGSTHMAQNSCSGAQEPRNEPNRPKIQAVKIRTQMRLWSKFTVQLEQMGRDNAVKAQLGRPPRWSYQQIGDVRQAISQTGRMIAEWVLEYSGGE